MLSPDYLYHVSDRAIELYEQLNSFAVRDICRRLVNADFQFTGSIDWQMYKLQQSGMLLDDIVAEVAKITKKSEKEIAEIFEEATYKSQSYDNDVYKRAGLTPIDIRQSPQMLKILQATYEQTMGEIRNFTRTTASACQSLFLETMDEVSFRVLSGQQSYTEAVRQAINTVSSAGLQIRYPSGHIDTIETAVRRCVITGVGQATARVSIQNAQEMDTDLVLVSSHLGARPSHAEWQGKVYSISGNSKKYSKLSDATGYGTVSGLCGANCRHHFMPYIDGVSTNPYEKFDSKENQKRYDDLQEQRRQERGIRSTKRELQATKESIDATKDDNLKFALQQDYDRKAEKLKAQRDAYDEFSQKAGLPTQAERLQVAGWRNSNKDLTGSLDDENQRRYAARREEWKKKHALLSEQKSPVIDKDALKQDVNSIRAEKSLAQSKFDALEIEEKALTKKVYFDGTGTQEEADRLRKIADQKKSVREQIDALDGKILEKQYVYKTATENRILESGTLEDIKLSKKMTPEAVDELENTLYHLKEKYGIMPKGVIYDPAKVPDATASYNWIDDKIYLSNRFNDPDKYLDIIKKSEDSLKEYRRHYDIVEKAKEEIRNMDAILADKSIKGYEREKAVLAKADAEIRLNTSRQAVRESISDVFIHEYGHFINRHAETDYIQKKNVFGMRDIGGKLINGDWKFDMNTDYSRSGKIAASKISAYATDNPYEAFAEGFLAMEKGEKIPEEIAKVINEAMEKAGVKNVAKYADSGIMNVVETIHKSVGAKSKNYDVYNPLTGGYIHLAEGTNITQPKNHIIAGKGRERQIDCIDWLMDEYPGVDEEEWTKEKGFGYVLDEYGDKRKVELHWYQNPVNGKVEMKIKRQPGGEIYIDED